MADLADNAAAVAAGYVRTQTDRGASFAPRYFTTYEKPMTGSSGGFLEKARGESNSSQAAASANALTVLNSQRASRYGAGNKDAKLNNMVLDN